MLQRELPFLRKPQGVLQSLFLVTRDLPQLPSPFLKDALQTHQEDVYKSLGRLCYLVCYGFSKTVMGGGGQQQLIPHSTSYFLSIISLASLSTTKHFDSFICILFDSICFISEWNDYEICLGYEHAVYFSIQVLRDTWPYVDCPKLQVTLPECWKHYCKELILFSL